MAFSTPMQEHTQSDRGWCKVILSPETAMLTVKYPRAIWLLRVVAELTDNTGKEVALSHSGAGLSRKHFEAALKILIERGHVSVKRTRISGGAGSSAFSSTTTASNTSDV
jgi:hypothetical protein